MNYARTDVNNVVINIEVWSEAPPAMPGVTFVESDTAKSGDLWDGSTFTTPPPAPEPLPPEIPMHKARKALKQLGPHGAVTPETYGASWWIKVTALIGGLENPIQRDSILDELNTAPNMVLAGASTQMVKAAVGMTDDDLEIVARLALTLP
jgi:hypothetical protein